MAGGTYDDAAARSIEADHFLFTESACSAIGQLTLQWLQSDFTRRKQIIETALSNRMQVNTMALLGLQSKEDVRTYGRQALQDAITASAALLDRVNSGAEVG